MRQIYQICGSVFGSELVTDDVKNDLLALERIVNKQEVFLKRECEQIEIEAEQHTASNDEEIAMVEKSEFSTFWKTCFEKSCRLKDKVPRPIKF